MRKKVLKLIIVLVLLSFTFATIVNAYSFTASMVSSSSNVEENQEVVVTVALHNLDVGTNGINMLGGYLKYDHSVFETIDETSFEALNSWMLSNYNSESGKVTFARTTFTKDDQAIFQLVLRTKVGTTGKIGEISFINISASNSAQTIAASDVSTAISVGNTGNTIIANIVNNVTNIVNNMVNRTNTINVTNTTNLINYNNVVNNSTNTIVINTVNNNIILNTVDNVVIGASANGINLYAYDRYKDFPGGAVSLGVYGSNASGKLYGVQAEVDFEGATPYAIESCYDEWEVTSYKIEENKITFLVEPTEEIFRQGNWNSFTGVIIKYNENASNENHKIRAYVNKEKIKTTHAGNVVIEPLANVLGDVDNLEVSSRILDENPIRVNPAAGADESIKIEGNNIYAKLFPNPANGMVPVLQLTDSLDLGYDCTSFTIYSDTLGGEHTFYINDFGTEVEDAIRNNEDGVWTFGNAYKLRVNRLHGEYEYNVYEMGNTYIDDVYVGGVININDVIYLRQAIVGMEEALSDSNFRVEASDVTFSNAELGTLGDIGDIMAIRERILLGYWRDMSTPIVIPDEPLPFTEEEIKEALENYLEAKRLMRISYESFLVELGLQEYNQYSETDDDGFIITDIEYSAYKERVLNYVTENWNNEASGFAANVFTKNVDGYLHYDNYDILGIPPQYEVNSISLKGDYSEKTYIANVYETLFDGSRTLENIEFHIENYNGKCVIDYCD